MSNDQHTTPAHLYYVSIKELNLSQKSIDALERYGVTTVGDCLDHFERVRLGGNPGRITLDYIQAIHGEVLQKLVKHGYMTSETAKDFDYQGK